MQVQQVSLNNLARAEGGDLCARSALRMNEPMAHSIIYTFNLKEAAEFYVGLMGKDNIRFKADNMIAFRLGGTEVILQEVQKGSPFGELVGRQTVGLAANGDDLMERVKKVGGEPMKIDAQKDLGWDTSVAMVKDPLGNMVQLVKAG